MATINTSSSGKTYLTGLISNIDTASLIETAVKAKLTKSDRLDDTISTNTTKISAYQDLQGYIQEMTDALDALRSTNSDNAFNEKQVTAKSSDSTSAENIVSATTTSSAAAGTYRVVVQQLAQAMSVASSLQSSADSALGQTGVFNLQLEGYAGAEIAVTADMSLRDIADAINDASGETGVTADLLQTGSGYKLVLTGAVTAESFTTSSVSGDDIMSALGVLDSGGDFASVSQAAQQAILTLNGSTIESDSNTLTNVLGGLTLELTNAAPSTTVTLTVGNNTEGVKEAISTLVDAYNQLRAYIAQNREITDGAVSSYAYLYAESLLSSLDQSLGRMTTQSYGSSDYNSLGSIGITINEDNKWELDDTTLDTALAANFSGVVSLFSSDDSHTGLADALYEMLDSYANETTGSIAARIEEISSVNTKLTSEADRIKEMAEAYRDMLIEKYSAMEVQMQAANILKAQIQAIMDSGSDNG